MALSSDASRLDRGRLDERPRARLSAGPREGSVPTTGAHSTHRLGGPASLNLSDVGR
jgi:hypothetical protein